MSAIITSVPFLFGLLYDTEYIVVPVLFSCGGAEPFWRMSDTFTLYALNLAACTSSPTINAHNKWFLPDGQRHASVAPFSLSSTVHRHLAQLPAQFTIHLDSCTSGHSLLTNSLIKPGRSGCLQDVEYWRVCSACGALYNASELAHTFGASTATWRSRT